MANNSGGQPDTLVERIAALRPPARERFSVALWRGRGWTVEHGGADGDETDPEREAETEWATLVAESPTGRQNRRLFVPTATSERLYSADDPAPPPLGDEDRLVWPVAPAEADDSTSESLPEVEPNRVIDAAGLAERYRYALDSATQAQIAADVFDTDAETLLDRPERTVESPDDTPLAADARTPEQSVEARETEVRPAGEVSGEVEADVATASTESAVGGGGESGGDSSRNPDVSVAGDRGGRDRRRQSRVALAGTLTFALLLVGAAAVGVGPLAPALADAVGEDDDFGERTVWVWQFASREGGGTTGDTALDTGPDRVSTAVPSVRGEQSVLPPGVASDGTLEPSVLAGETERVLSNTSYRFVLTYRERVEGNTTARWREVATVENGTHFASEVSLLGTPVESPGYIDRTPQYADGTQYAEDGETTTVENRRVSTEDPFLPRILQYIDWFLTVSESRLLGVEERGGVNTTLIGLRDDPWPGVENTTGFAVVSERGVVRAIHRSYNPPGRPGVTVTVTVRVTDVGETTVDRPRWLSERTENQTTTPATATTTPTATDSTANGTATATETPA
jgi:hypothetical protein